MATSAEERRGWLVAAVMFLSLFFVWGTTFNSVGVFFEPLIKEFGWSHTEVSLLPTATLIGSTTLAPFVGSFLDRFAAQRIVAAGAVMTACGFLLASQIHSLWMLMVAGFLVGAGMAAGTQLPASLLITDWFSQSRGIALALTLSGATAGGAIMTPILAFVVDRDGWRTAYVVVAAPILLLVFPLVLILVRTKTEHQAVGIKRARSARRPDTLEGLEVGEAMVGRSFWLIVIATIVYGASAGAVAVHMIPLLTNRGWTSQNAAFWVSTTMVLGVIGKLILGRLADWTDVRLALFTAFSLMAVGCLLLAGPLITPVVASAIMLYGFGFATPFALFPMLEAEVFGARRYGTLTGTVIMLGAIGGGAGPVLAGRSFDQYASYSPILLLFSALLIFAAFVPYGCTRFIG